MKAADRTPPGDTPKRSCLAPRSKGALDGARHLDASGDGELAKDVTHVRLDRLRTSEKHVRNLRIGPTINDEPRDLKLALRQRCNADSIALTRPSAPVDAMAKVSQFALGCGTISERATRVKL